MRKLLNIVLKIQLSPVFCPTEGLWVVNIYAVPLIICFPLFPWLNWSLWLRYCHILFLSLFFFLYYSLNIIHYFSLKTFYFVLGSSWLTSNVVIDSGEQWRDSAIHINVFLLLQIPIPSRLPHNIELSFMCYVVDPCFLPSSSVYMSMPKSLTISYLILPLCNHKHSL